MRAHLAECSDQTFCGNIVDCLHWAKEQVRRDPSAVVSIYRFRAGEKVGKVFGQITSDGIMRPTFPTPVNRKDYKNVLQEKNAL